MAKMSASGYISFLAKRFGYNQSKAIAKAREKGYKISNDKARAIYNTAVGKTVSKKTRKDYNYGYKKFLGYRRAQDAKFAYIVKTSYYDRFSQNEKGEKKKRTKVMTYKTDTKIENESEAQSVINITEDYASLEYEFDSIDKSVIMGYYEQYGFEQTQ